MYPHPDDVHRAQNGKQAMCVRIPVAVSREKMSREAA
jgi:hypothetical protein